MSLEDEIEDVVRKHRAALLDAVAARRAELLEDDTSHQEMYRLLGVPPSECAAIDLYQNVGRFVYKYTGALLEDATFILLRDSGDGRRLSLPNKFGLRPVNFEIDCFTEKDNRAHEIKWRDATTDGDHITKETNKVAAIVEAGHIPVRVMYFAPVRAQARRIQARIISKFRESGFAYVGPEAWSYISDYSGVDLLEILRRFDYPHPDWLEWLEVNEVIDEESLGP